MMGEAGAVGCACDDSAGISGAFAEYVKPVRIHAFERVVVARDADWRTGARFRRDNQPFVNESGDFPVKVLEAFGEALANGFVHPVPEIALHEPAGIGGFGDCRIFFVCEERLDGLCGGGVVVAADAVGVAFYLALEIEAAEQFFACGNGDGDGTVGEGAVAAAVAHAVCREGAGFRGAGHQDATGAHAKAVSAACLAQCRRGEEVFRGSGEVCVYALAELLQVDEHLRVLDAHAHGESLAFEGDATGV